MDAIRTDPARHRASNTLLYVALGVGLLLAGLLVVSSDASAQSINSVQPYAWIEPGANDNSNPDDTETGSSIPQHTWVAISSDQNGRNEFPARGFHLVQVDWSDANQEVEQIRFRYRHDSSGDEVFRTFRLDQDESSALGQNVHLANTSVAFDTGDTGPDGCDDAGFRQGTCWFLVETFDDEDPTSSMFSSSNLGDDFRLSVRLRDADGNTLTDWQTFTTDVVPVDLDASVSSVAIDPDDTVTIDGSPGVEVGESTTINVTVGMGDVSSSDTSRTQADWNTGDIDVWVCLYREDVTNPRGPYDGFPDLFTGLDSATAWDDPVDCEFRDFPTHDQGAKDDGNGAGAELLPFQDRTVDLDSPQEDEERYFETAFRFEDANGELETEGGSFVDRFYFRVILRDSWGNVEQLTLDGQTDSSSGSAASPFTAGLFDVSHNSVEINLDSTPTVQEFRDRTGCFQDVRPNDASEPCFRSIDYAPPDQVFEFPLTVNNSGNVEDSINLDWQHEDGEQSGWSVEFFDPNTDTTVSEGNFPMTVDVAPGSPDNPNSREIVVRVTPGSQTIARDPAPSGTPDAPGSREIRVWAWSDKTLDSTAESDAKVEGVASFLQAHLVQKDNAALRWGPDGVNDLGLSLKTEEIKTVDLAIENNGNNDGPFQPHLDTDSTRHEDECQLLNEDGVSFSEQKVNLEFKDGGTRVNDGRTVLPGKSRSFDIEVEVGSQVPIGTYDCVFRLDNTESDESGTPINVPLNPTEPTLTIEVTGKPVINVIEVRGTDRDAFNVTGQEIELTVPPATDEHEVYIYLENTGDVALDPELEDSPGIFRIKDPLPGTWRGVFDESNPDDDVSLSTAAQPFTLPVSDGDDADEILVRDLFPSDDEPPSGDASFTSDDPWTCAGQDGVGDDDTDERIVCRLHFRFDVSDDTPVAGDEALYNFTWQDPDEEAPPSTVHVRLTFGHVGTVRATDVTEKVLARGDSSTVTFDAQLTDEHQFDPEDQQITGEVFAEFAPTGAPVCDSGTASIQSTSKQLRSASFRPTVTLSQGPCDVSEGPDAGSIAVTADNPGRVKLWLNVVDENGTELRQIHPVRLRMQPGSANVDDPSEPSDFQIRPDVEMEANGTQFARFSFNPGPDGDNFPQGTEGLLLTRKTQESDLVPFPRCRAGGTSVATDGPALQWRALAPSPDDVAANGTVAPEFFDRHEGRDTLQADASVAGVILTDDQTQDGRSRARQVGNVTIWGWGDGSDLAWTEGWNPVVLRVMDTDGEPAETGEQGSLQLDLDLQFVKRDANGQITDAYELTSQSDAIRVRELGNGFVAADVYLPATIGKDGFSGDLGDSTSTDSNAQSIEHEAFALHARVSGESTDGDNIDGDAYWQLDDLGIVDDADGADDEEGTVGASQVTAGIKATRERFSGQSDQNPDQDTIEFLHVAPHFVEPLMQARSTGDADWVTGPGVQDYGVFLLEETQNPTDSPSGFEDGNTTDDFKEHTFDPFQNADVRLRVEGQDRLGVPGSSSTKLTESSDFDSQGFYTDFFVLPDTGLDTFDWFTQLTVKDDQGEVAKLFRTIRADARMEPATNGLPMPLCLRAPQYPAGGVNPSLDNPAGDFDLDDRGIRRIVDLRTIPGLTVDRRSFGLAPLVEHTTGGVNFEIRPQEETIFTIQAPGLISIDESQVPTSAEEDVPIQLSISPKPASAVESVTAELSRSGSLVDSAQLVDDGSGSWTGSVTPTESQDHELKVTAIDTTGGGDVVRVTVNVTENQPPRISMGSPSEVDDIRAMRSDASISATVTDRSVTAEAITVETRIGDGSGDQGDALSEGNVSIDGITSRAGSGDHSITVTIANRTTGTAWVNVSGSQTDGFNASLSNGEATGTITLPDSGTATLSVETNGTGVSHTFDVEIVQTTSGGFSSVSLASDEIDCSGETTCQISFSPDGLSDGDTLDVRITASIENDAGEVIDENTETFTIQIDDVAPTGLISITSPKVSGTPTVVGPRTIVEVSGSDEVGIDAVTLVAVRDGSATGSRTVSGTSGEVEVSQIGLSEDGDATLRLNVSDIAGNTASETVNVEVDGTGPSIGAESAQPAGSALEISVEVTDAAGVDSVQLFTRKPGEASFSPGRGMTADGGSTYAATVDSPGSTGTLRYYVEATDRLGNQDSLGARGNPLAVELDQFNLTNAAPSVSFLAPADGASVSGTIEVELDISDPDGDTVTVTTLRVNPASGDTLPVDVSTGETTATVDTTELAEGRAVIEVEVSDGQDTARATRSVIVNNLPDAGSCEQDGSLETGDEVEVCFTFPTDENVTGLEVALIRNGETMASQSLDPDLSGQYRATFSIPDEGSYALRITAQTANGTTETTSEPFQVQSLGPGAGGEPLGTFVTTLVLGTITIALSAFAAFQRWD